MSIKFLDLYKQYLSIKKEIETAMAEVIAKSAFIGGEFVEKFECEFANYIGVKHCICVANGTDALEIALYSLDLPRDSEVLVPANSFIASAEAVVNMGLKPVFVDMGDDFCLDIKSAKKMLSDKTKAIIPVHLYGQPCGMGDIIEFAKKHSLFVVEDCAQAHGAQVLGQKVGSIGVIGCFSFYPGKNLGCFGDGGAITTNDDALAKKIRMYKNHGRTSKYDHEFVGRNSRLDGLQAAILSVKLKHLDGWIEHRNSLANHYLKHLNLATPKLKEGIRHSWHLFVAVSQNRDVLMDKLKASGIECGIHYPKLLPNLAAFKDKFRGDTENAQKYEDKLLTLPIGEHLEFSDIDKVLEVINA